VDRHEFIFSIYSGAPSKPLTPPPAEEPEEEYEEEYVQTEEDREYLREMDRRTAQAQEEYRQQKAADRVFWGGVGVATAAIILARASR
jgi:hypothetical protein